MRKSLEEDDLKKALLQPIKQHESISQYLEATLETMPHVIDITSKSQTP